MTDSAQAARFQQVVLPHMDAAYNLARWLTSDAQEAEDVTQEAFLRAFRFFDSFRGEDARTWLLAIVRNVFYTQWRRSRSSGASTEFDEEMHSFSDDESLPSLGRADTNPESILSRNDDIRLLDQALQALPVEYREALVLRELEDLSYKEIATTLDIPIGTVMSRLARARRLMLDSFKRLSKGNHELQRSQNPALRVR
ncbi:MAG TPA: RNA polymerase sigma factor [Usitatibacter sp.]|nr:RNA polymerase sigma factor [Usitatibacter sp.]